jgi:hypothetical protein
MITLAESLSTEPSLLGVSAHLLAIAFAPAAAPAGRARPQPL